MDSIISLLAAEFLDDSLIALTISAPDKNGVIEVKAIRKK